MLKYVVASRRVILDTAPSSIFPIILLARRRYAAHTSRPSGSEAATPSTKSKSKSPQAPSKPTGPANLINFIYEPFPQPFNCTTLPQTRLFASDPSHPFYIKIQRRVAAHNPEDFVWVVRCPADVSKKPTYRHDVTKKLRRAFKQALRKQGYDETGRQLADKDLTRDKQASSVVGGETTAETTGRLSGALSMFYIRDPERVLTAKGDQIRAEAERILDSVLKSRSIAKMAQGQGQGKWKGAVKGKGKGKGKYGLPFATREKQRDRQEWQLGKKREARADRAASSRLDWQRSC